MLKRKRYSVQLYGNLDKSFNVFPSWVQSRLVTVQDSGMGLEYLPLFLITEDEDFITTEAGDYIVSEG